VRSGHYCSKSRGFTLLEALAAVITLAIVSVLLFPNARDFLLRAGEAGCLANMRSITAGLHGYLHDHQNVWPQGPSLNEETAWEAFWLQPLKPYGITEKTWQCPAFNSVLATQGVPTDERPKVHYVPTMFSAEPGIATRWATQPWLIERANVHKNGPHISFPDGSIKSFNKILAEMGVR
jgi:type II secretory pathway pseudopilin PulG